MQAEKYRKTWDKFFGNLILWNTNDGFNNGFNDGFSDGLQEGKQKQLILMVCKKLLKGKGPNEIADELEEDLDAVAQICLAAKSFAPDYNCDKVYKALTAEHR